ncbi:hypothetical protein H072_4337 [Dactylellina haptotyla CBS 200.50]|uniref:Uncharacterized protein n=1 Tax=Dactylellina haptotyla (strain CBS 200.50) TaxID=1284197 RepID=S8BQM7_DACHA|nr:hypothetical protein H072_4337 [Dactylellina haptotyla CBS 200.50]
MAEDSVPGGRATVLTLPTYPPSNPSSSVYAASEASTETTTTFSGASFATNSTIGDFAYGHTTPAHTYVPRDASNTLPSNPSTNTPLPLLQFPDGDTLLFISPPPTAASADTPSFRYGAKTAPLRVLSSKLLSSGSQVFTQLLAPPMQQRILNRLVKQKKIVLIHGKLPQGIRFVMDLTPEDEGEKAVEWQEKLWCPDIVLRWKSSLVEFEPLPPPSDEDKLAKTLDEFRQKEWGGAQPDEDGAPSSPTQVTTPPPRKASLPKKDNLPEYSFGRHVLALERLVHILHGIDPLVQHTVDWYTLHCLSVAFGTTDATRDYIARWIFANSLMIETHPAFIWQVSVEAGLATIASDAFAAAVIRYSFDPTSAQDIPGAVDAAIAFATRAQKEFKELLGVAWVDQYLPPQPSEPNTIERSDYDTFRTNLQAYISRQMKFSGGVADVSLDDPIHPQAMARNVWASIQQASLCSEISSLSPPLLDKISQSYLQVAIFHWNRWEASTEGESVGNDDLWKDVKLGAPQYPLPSVTQQTTIDNNTESVFYNEDARSEIASQTGTEIATPGDDVRSISSTSTLNHAMRGLATTEQPVAPEPIVNTFSKVDNDMESPKSKPVSSPKSSSIELRDDSNIDYLGNSDNYSEQKTDMFTFESDHGPETRGTQYRPIRPLYPQSDHRTPEWLRLQLSALSNEHSPAHFWALMHHPNNDFTRAAEPRIRCLDCPDILYFAGPGETLQNFRIHLRNIKHIDRLQSRKLSEGLPGVDTTNASINPEDSSIRNPEVDAWETRYNPKPAPSTDMLSISIPNNLVSILRLCDAYVNSKCAEMSARNVVFEPILLEEQLACLEESERAFMPLWSGGEAVPSNNKAGTSNRGVGGSSASENMSVNVSSIGVGSVCTASTTDSFVAVNTPSNSSSASVVSMSDEDDVVMSSSEEVGDDWVMDEDDDEDDSFEDDDDIYFS